MQLLENENVHALASLLMRDYLLWDLSAPCALQALQDDGTPEASWAFHRDHTVRGREGLSLWCFFCPDDITSENGATWIVPGSHCISSAFEGELMQRECLDQFPSRDFYARAEGRTQLRIHQPLEPAAKPDWRIATSGGWTYAFDRCGTAFRTERLCS